MELFHQAVTCDSDDNFHSSNLLRFYLFYHLQDKTRDNRKMESKSSGPP